MKFWVLTLLLVGGGMLVGAVQAMPAKPVWDYTCYLSFNGAVGFVNSLSQGQAIAAKFVAVNSDRSFGQPYCVVYPK